MANVDWVVKASKLCNLRCRYCYEWNDLADPTRMPLDLWRRILAAIRDYSEFTHQRFGRRYTSRIIWHGGEPLLLPPRYAEAVLALQHEILPAEDLVNGWVRNVLQTNLYVAPTRWLELIREHHFGVGVSFDGISGARLSLRGSATEERVVANLDRLRKHGIKHGMIVVLAGHTANDLVHIHDLLATRNLSFRVLPLFRGPSERPLDGLELSSDEIVDALFELFRHWFGKGCPVAITPLKELFLRTIMKMLHLERPIYDRAQSGDRVLLVNVDGKVYPPGAGYEASACLGDLSSQTIGEILSSGAYRRSLDRDARARREICGRCEFLGACETYPLFASEDGGIEAGRCLVAQPLSRKMETLLVQEGFDAAELRQIFHHEVWSRATVELDGLGV